MRTYFPKKGDIEPRWFIIDAENLVLGRLSSTIANIISGKAKPTYTPFLDTGDHVITRSIRAASRSAQRASSVPKSPRR